MTYAGDMFSWYRGFRGTRTCTSARSVTARCAGRSTACRTRRPSADPGCLDRHTLTACGHGRLPSTHWTPARAARISDLVGLPEARALDIVSTRRAISPVGAASFPGPARPPMPPPCSASPTGTAVSTARDRRARRNTPSAAVGQSPTCGQRAYRTLRTAHSASSGGFHLDDRGPGLRPRPPPLPAIPSTDFCSDPRPLPWVHLKPPRSPLMTRACRLMRPGCSPFSPGRAAGSGAVSTPAPPPSRLSPIRPGSGSQAH